MGVFVIFVLLVYALQPGFLAAAEPMPSAPSNTPLVRDSRPADTAQARLVYFQTDQRYAYRIKLLKEVMVATRADYGEYSLAPVSSPMTQARGVTLLGEGIVVSVAFLPTSPERENKLLPIRIPIMQGILGYRLLLSHAGIAAQIARVETVEQLAAGYIAGFGLQWSDLAILKANRLNVVGSSQYDALFAMLNAKRFDYFPRGINEAWGELKKYSNQYPGLRVVDDIALYYPYPVYFFVNNNNQALARRIEVGLQRLMQSGRFDELFQEHHRDLINESDLRHRRILKLSNPTLPINTPEIKTDWLTP
ncbi:MAG: transporter substrate-binding domain-containing protein [Pseudomonadales bacterium]|nr:transporter substrate-binding domain-containing protein [Pseudomonadales bacterium]